MNSLLISILVLGLSSVSDNLLMLSDRLSNASFEMAFDINKFEDDKLREYPGITNAPSYGKFLGVSGQKGVGSSIGDWLKCMAGCFKFPAPMYNTPYEALRWVGFTHEQILGAKRISTNAYEVKTPT